MQGTISGTAGAFLAVPAGWRTGGRPVATVVLAGDDPAVVRGVLGRAVELADGLGACLRLGLVHPSLPSPLEDPERVAEDLARAARDLGAAGVAARVSYCPPERVAFTLADAAHDLDADLVLLAAHPHGAAGDEDWPPAGDIAARTGRPVLVLR